MPCLPGPHQRLGDLVGGLSRGVASRFYTLVHVPMRVASYSRRSLLDLNSICVPATNSRWLTWVSYRLWLLHARVCVVALSLRRLGGMRLLAGLDLRLSETDCDEDREDIVGVRLRGAKVGRRLEEGHCLLMGCRLEY